jgi:hypothetical protein
MPRELDLCANKVGAQIVPMLLKPICEHESRCIVVRSIEDRPQELLFCRHGILP